ncbi:ciliary microtubule inner protein 2C [Mobula birostris]|uniref:ciliary microtubule inner protein 2C n=1 Tax=Mobula birostris TaxID=1983395 RepID=UPI003B28D3BC
MASRSAGTLITNYNATYIPPALMPGYRGFVPTINFTHGDTYGNTTRKYFEDFRMSALNTSQSPYSKGGQFPTIYSNNPSLVIENRMRNRNRWLYAPQWSRYDVDFDREEEMKLFNKLSQQHRENYKDKTGIIPRVDHFVLPGKEEDTFPSLPNIQQDKDDCPSPNYISWPRACLESLCKDNLEAAVCISPRGDTRVAMNKPPYLHCPELDKGMLFGGIGPTSPLRHSPQKVTDYQAGYDQTT